jgi:hypothetical protein
LVKKIKAFAESGSVVPRSPSIWSSTLIGRHVEQLSGFNPGRALGVPDKIDAYIGMNVCLAWRPRPNLELSVVGQNLLDNHHLEFGTNAAVRSPLVEIERSVYGKIAWRF